MPALTLDLIVVVCVVASVLSASSHSPSSPLFGQSSGFTLLPDPRHSLLRLQTPGTRSIQQSTSTEVTSFGYAKHNISSGHYITILSRIAQSWTLGSSRARNESSNRTPTKPLNTRPSDGSSEGASLTSDHTWCRHGLLQASRSARPFNISR